MRAGVVLGCVLLLASSGVAAPTAQDLAFFENKVRPLLAEHCLRCHGAKKQESGLRLDGRNAILRGGASGPAVVVGKPGESLLLRVVRHQGDVHMPPDKKLPAADVAILVKWIELGL